MMQQLHDLMSNVLENGTRQSNRTGIDAISLPGAMLSFDLQNGFPAITTKKLAFNSMKEELLGFFRGCQSAADFRALGCGFWDQNANETQSWLDSEFRKGTDDLGRVYGVQWTDWKDWQEVQNEDDYRALLTWGYELVAQDQERGVWVMRRGINQLKIAWNQIVTNPTSRRIIVNAWRPEEFDRMALPPCHVMYQFLVNVEKQELNLCMYQRSADIFLGVPMNIASSALFLSIMAKLAGLKAGTFTHFLADAHIYVNHIDQVREQLSRDHFPAPSLALSICRGKPRPSGRGCRA